MNRSTRSKLLGLAAGTIATGTLLPHARAARPWVPAGAEAPADVAAPLLEQAADWIDVLRTRGQTYLFFPVSRLERKFRIDYDATCVLVDVLAERGEWTIRFSGDGTRYARLHPRMRA